MAIGRIIIKIIRRIDNIHHKLSEQSVVAWFVLCLVGFVIAALAWPINNGALTFHGQMLDGALVNCLKDGLPVKCAIAPKQIGYWYALNWSLTGILILPTIIALGLRLHWEIEHSLRGIAQHNMARTLDRKIIGEEQLLARWAIDRRVGGFLAPLTGIIGFIFVMGGWLSQVGLPILHGQVPADWLFINGPNEEFDWSIASILDVRPDHVGRLSSFIFDLVAYLLIPGLVVLYGFATLLDGAFFVAFACAGDLLPSRAAQGLDGADLPTKWRLAPDLRDGADRRCGFGVFEGLFTTLLGCALSIMLALFFVITQNAYLRDATSTSIFDFFSADWQGAAKAAQNLFGNKAEFSKNLGNILVSEKAINIFNPKSIFSVLVFLLVVIVSVVTSWGLLRSAAFRSQNFAREKLPEFAASLGLSPEMAESRLGQMRAWPLAWISEALVLSIIILFTASLISFRLIMVPILLGVLWALYQLVRVIRPEP